MAGCTVLTSIRCVARRTPNSKQNRIRVYTIAAQRLNMEARSPRIVPKVYMKQKPGQKP